MDGLKGFAEVAKHILYETFGLLLPGGLALLAVAGAVDPGLARAAIAFGRENTWLALGAAYVLGYPLQALSRPVTVAAEAILTAPTKLILWIIHLLPAVGSGIDRLERALTGRHAHTRDQDKRSATRVEFDALLGAYWGRRLGLPEGRRLSSAQARDLSFSQLLAERDGLDRFRAATSLTRAAAAVTVIVLGILGWQLVLGERRVTWPLVGVIELLLLAFYGLLERADMYDGLWRSALRSQLLCAVTRERALDPFSVLEWQAMHGSAEAPDPAPPVPPDAEEPKRVVTARAAVDVPASTTPPSEQAREREGRGAEPPPREAAAPAPVPGPTALQTSFTPHPTAPARAPQESDRVQ